MTYNGPVGEGGVAKGDNGVAGGRKETNDMDIQVNSVSLNIVGKPSMVV